MENIIKDKRNIVIVVITLICITVVIASMSYAFIMYNAEQKTLNEAGTDCIEVELVDETDAISLVGTSPMSDSQGANTTPYRFTITNKCSIGVDYSINLEVLDIEDGIESKNISTRVDGNDIKKLTEGESKTPTYVGDDYTAKESYAIYNGSLKGGARETHHVRVWLNSEAGNETQNKRFLSKITIEAKQNNLVDAYKESILNGTDPVLGEGLIPVVIADDGTVTKANIETEWYSYEDKVWANAVILEDESITYNNYDVIPESNIESYFVWIPRYKYKIWDEGQYTELTTIDESKVHTIQVEFETRDVAASTGSTTNSWLTHPAFTSFDVNGLWVGKFESGYKGATSTATAQVNENNPEKLQIKPNVYSWRSILPSNMYLTSYNYNRDLDSHMMKNTEWGAVAYLQHSVYGSQQSVRINNNASFITGYAAINEPTIGYTSTNISCSTTPDGCNEYGTSTSVTQAYNTETGYLASTTGNITGIYDMSGGAWEYMMGILADSSGNPMSGRHNVYNSGFLGTYGCPTCDSTLSGIDSSIKENTTGKSWPDKKYYDLYTYQTSASSYKNRILGDATGELGPFQSMTYGSQTRQINSWYDDEGWFVYSTNPWFIRGGSPNDGTGAGVFDFFRDDGGAWADHSFRVVLAI